MLRLPPRSAALVLAGALWLPGSPLLASVPAMAGLGPRAPQAQGGKSKYEPDSHGPSTKGPKGKPASQPLSQKAGQPLSQTAGGFLELTLGVTIDLDRLDFADSKAFHASVGRAAGEAIALRPGSKVRFSSTRRGPTSPDDVGTWAVPTSSDPGLRENRTALLRTGDSLFFVLPDGRVGRLEVRHSSARGWELSRDIAAPGQVRIPRPPSRPVVAVVDAAVGHVILSAPKVRDAKSAAQMVHEVEAERPIGSGQWVPVERFVPGQHESKIQGLFGAIGAAEEMRPNALARVRVRRGFVGEPLSAPGPAIDLVAAGGNPELRRQAARLSVGGLVDGDFQLRLEASLALGLLEDEAREALRAAIDGEGDLAQAARERLRVMDAAQGGGPNLALRLAKAARAAALGEASVESGHVGGAFDEAPAGFVTKDPLGRAAALLRFVDRAERGARLHGAGLGSGAHSGTDSGTESGNDAAAFDVARDCAIAVAWASAMGELDPDPRVRQLATFLTELRIGPSIGAFEAPVPGWFLHGVARNEDVEFEPFADSREPMPAHALDLIFDLSAREELGDRRVGPALARIRAYLVAADARGDDVSITAESGFHDYDADLVELALRLVGRAATEPLAARKKELLGAVEALLPGPALTFAAWREMSDRRWASPLAVAGMPDGKVMGGLAAPTWGRRQVVLERADLGDLEQVLLDLALDAGALGSAFRGDVDILLPAGEYGEVSKRARVLDVPASGIRLLPRESGGEVVIHAGFRSIGAVDFVLQNVTVVHGAGQALTVMDGGHAVAIDSTLKGRSRVIHVSSGEVELYGCDALPAFGDPKQGTMLQLMGGGKFSARASVLRAGSLFIGQGGGDIWLDRCVLDSADRPIVQGQLGGRLVTRETLLRGDGAGLMSVEQGMLAATVLEAAFQPIGRGGEALLVSPGLFALMGSSEDGVKAGRFAIEPLPVK